MTVYFASDSPVSYTFYDPVNQGTRSLHTTLSATVMPHHARLQRLLQISVINNMEYVGQPLNGFKKKKVSTYLLFLNFPRVYFPSVFSTQSQQVAAGYKF